MPHIKSYAALNDVTRKPDWLLLTSANLSRAAWGKFEKNKTQLFVMSYELGVLVLQKNHPDEPIVLPYDTPVEKYDRSDQPFLINKMYAEADILGNTR